jgi:hypothetical protein
MLYTQKCTSLVVYFTMEFFIFWYVCVQNGIIQLRWGFYIPFKLSRSKSPLGLWESISKAIAKENSPSYCPNYKNPKICNLSICNILIATLISKILCKRKCTQFLINKDNTRGKFSSIFLWRQWRNHLSLGYNYTQCNHFMDNGIEYMEIPKGVATTILKDLLW